MKRVLVEELKSGMRFTKPVYIDNNNMLVGAYVSLKESDIKRLMKWGINEIETEGDLVAASVAGKESTEIDTILEKYSTLMNMRQDLMLVHSQACAAVSKAHSAIRNGRIFPTLDLAHSIDDIMKLLKKNNNVFLFLYGLEEKNDDMVVHAVNVTFYSLLIGISMKYTPNKLKELGLGSLMVNAGMVQIPAYIRHKQSNLTDHELNQIKTHPVLGYQALKKYGDFNEKSALISFQHHEQYDGNGYPRGIKGIDIDEYARIVAIADSYEALVEKRSYRNKQFFYHALKQLMATGARKFDPIILRIFVSLLSVYPIGSIVELNKGGVGVVIGSIPTKPLRPIIRLIFDESKNRIHDLVLVNLLEDQSLYVTKTLDEEEVGIVLSDIL